MTVSQKVVLRFPSEVADKPVVCELALQFGLKFNILQASISAHREGVMVLEMLGDKSQQEKALSFLRDKGLEIESLSQDIRKVEERCIHCGACVGVCPTQALYLEKPSFLVKYEESKCIACELCISSCFTGAMEALI
ncbi:MAG: L-aspartate semialdehyde sulfurtransferase ferredoxin [Candidatus Atribacteria bacterium]|nr:L-aspartate semialdehyde sulfurtransferase ferredoxin [Candidatus Atribacteria bacterium]